jgi:hypothetical protein
VFSKGIGTYPTNGNRYLIIILIVYNISI